MVVESVPRFSAIDFGRGPVDVFRGLYDPRKIEQLLDNFAFHIFIRVVISDAEKVLMEVDEIVAELITQIHRQDFLERVIHSDPRPIIVLAHDANIPQTASMDDFPLHPYSLESEITFGDEDDERRLQPGQFS